jgi:hypothetical protein
LQSPFQKRETLYFRTVNKSKTKKMKKVLALAAITGLFAVVACGPSKEEMEQAEKARQDSIAAAEKAVQDSIAQAEAAAAAQAAQDSMAAAAEQARLDSIAAAEAAAKKKATSKPKPKAPAAPETRTEGVKKADEKVGGKFGKK